MGVKGLTTMILQYPSLFTKHRLYDVRLVIDGYALLFYLYYERPIYDDGHHGGCYQEFATKCELFFANLTKCNISPYLVFDGAFEKDNKKLAEIKSRSLDRIRTAVGISGGRCGIAVSPCTVCVFMKVLDDLSIPYAFCDFEADAETAALANAWNCAAVSRDSDFYIMDLKAGYLPLDHLDWKNPRKVKIPETGVEPRARRRKMAADPAPCQLYIDCMKYKGSAFCKMFHVKQELLPVLATAVGNDYKDTFGASLDPFHAFVHSRFSTSGRRHFNQIMGYLAWLSEKDSVKEAISDMIKHSKGADRVKLMQLIEASLQMYQLSNSLTMVQFSDGVPNTSQSKLTEYASVPSWFVALLYRGKVTALCANVLCNKRVFLTIQVEDSSKPSAGVASLHIRAVLYGILLQNQMSISKKLPVVQEYAQWSGRLQHSIVEPVYEIFRDEQKLAVPGLDVIPAMSETDRRQALLATVGLNSSVIDTIHALFKLATCVTVYLVYRADPPLHSDHVIALIYTWLHGVAASIQRYISKGQDTPEHLKVGLTNSDVHAIMVNSKKCKYECYCKSRNLDVEVIHAMAQWQQCLLDLVNLNKVLLGPFSNPDMAVLYNGPLIHSVCIYLRSKSQTEQREWVKSELLESTTPGVHALFDQLLDPSWPLLTPRKKPKIRKKDKKDIYMYSWGR